jgi:hypothetical protein
MDKALKDFQVSSNGDNDIFWQKLTEENSWSLAFSKSAFEEYKKFIYLAKVCRCKVTPSKIVDKVWHLHMTFTKSYWSELCQEVLQMELHHIPSSQGKDAKLSDNECYEKTKELYNQEFGYAPPSLYWPQLKKSKFNKFHFSFISISCATLLTACTSTMFSDIELTLKWVVGIYVVYKILSWLGKGGSGGSGGCGSSGSNCSSSSCGSSCGGGGD